MIRQILQKRAKNFINFAYNYATEISSESKKSVSKEAMIKLRKKTNYSFVNCRKAILKFGEDNLEQAEKFLNEMAVKEGWAKAAVVGNRKTLHGQCGIITNNNLGVVVELKCETDFVSRSSIFKQLVSDIAFGIMNHVLQQKTFIRENNVKNGINFVEIDNKEIKLRNGKSVDETISLAIGQLGENIILTNAHLLISHAGLKIFGFSHPKEGDGNVEIGRFVSAVSIKQNKKESKFPIEKLAYQMCQHIIGMCPTSLKNSNNLTSEKENQKFQSTKLNENKFDDETNVEITTINENENALLNQSFMLNPSQTVNEYLNTHNCEIFDFWRFELGKTNEKMLLK